MMDVLVGLLCAASWAAGSVMMRDLTAKMDPFTMNAPRTLIGGLAILLFALLSGRPLDYAAISSEQLLFLLSSMLVGGGLGDTAYVVAIARIGVSRAFPISSVYPAITLVFGLLFLREQVTWTVVLGLALAVGGVILIGRPASDGASASARSVPAASGVGYALAAALCWAASTVMIAPGVRGLDPITVATLRVPALSLAFWGVVALRRTWSQYRTLTRRDWWLIVCGGVVGWGLGSVLFVLSVQLLGATRSAILTSTSPLFALPMSAVFLHERIHRGVLLGTVMAVAGVVLIS